MASVKNLSSILEKMKAAGTPPKFSYEFLKNLGFTSSNDRSVIKVLKALGFLTADGTPTERYNEFRNAARSRSALDAGLREGWADVFLADQSAGERSSNELIELFKNVTGKGEAVSQKLATTFKTLADAADLTAAAEMTPATADEPAGDEADPAASQTSAVLLHHDVHIHLPPSSDVAVYTAIFRALRQELLD